MYIARLLLCVLLESREYLHALASVLMLPCCVNHTVPKLSHKCTLDLSLRGLTLTMECQCTVRAQPLERYYEDACTR